MIYKKEINGIPIEAEFTEEDIEEKYLPFLKMLTAKQKEKGSRVLVLLAAPPGCGKTTLLSFLQELAEKTEGVAPITVIGMDGFHRYQDYLLSHTVLRDGEEIPMVKIKGAPVTFDLEKLTAAVKRVADGEVIGWPSYNRMTHNPQEKAVTVTGDIVLLEGNYLLLEEEGWRDLRRFADVTVKMSADEELLRKRLIDRHYKSGKSLEEAAAFVEFSDLANARVCLQRSGKADIEWMVGD